MGRHLQQVGDHLCRALDDVLAVVEDEQQAAPDDMVSQRVRQPITRLGADATPAADILSLAATAFTLLTPPWSPRGGHRPGPRRSGGHLGGGVAAAGVRGAGSARPSDAEVHEHRPPVGRRHDVGGLHVAVDHLPCAEMADRPIADLPDEITLTRDEAAVVLFALDVVDSAVSEPEEAEKVRRAVRLLTRKLWPKLGDLLDDEGEE